MTRPAALTPAARNALACILLTGWAPGGCHYETTSALYFDEHRAAGFVVYSSEGGAIYAVAPGREEASRAAVATSPVWKAAEALRTAGFAFKGWEATRRRRRYLVFERLDAELNGLRVTIDHRGSTWVTTIVGGLRRSSDRYVAAGAQLPADVLATPAVEG